MTPKIYLDLLNLICVGLLGWGIVRPERVYQFPFFMGAIFVSFILPQAIALYNNPGLPSQDALSRVLLMTCLCAAMCWLGYRPNPRPRFLERLNVPLNEHKLLRVGLFLMGVSYFFNWLLSRTEIQVTDVGTWQGPATIYIFFANVIYIAFAIFLLNALRKPTLRHLTLVALAAYPILQSIIFSGRRQPTITFLIVVGFSVWYVRRLLPPRWFFLIAVFGGLYLIPLIGYLRDDFWELVLSGNWTTILDLAQQSFNHLMQGNILELRNAALNMDAAARTRQYGFGTGFWDEVVFQYVPGQIVGYEFKSSLQFKLTEYNLTQLYGYRVPPGATVTAIGDSFVQFDYFGCLIFAMMAYFYKHLWVSAVYQRSTFSTLLYVGLIGSAMIGVTHGIGRFCQELVFQLIFVGLAARYARIRTPQASVPHYDGVNW